MSIQFSALIPSQQVPSTATLMYISASGVTTRIDSLSVCNTTASAVTLTTYLIPSGGSPGDSNTIVDGQAILPGQTWNDPYSVGKVLAAGDALWMVASVASALTVQASGLQQTSS